VRLAAKPAERQAPKARWPDGDAGP